MQGEIRCLLSLYHTFCHALEQPARQSCIHEFGVAERALALFYTVLLPCVLHVHGLGSVHAAGITPLLPVYA